MITSKELHVFLRGGLGNQLFQYSTGIAIAQVQDRELVLRGDLLPKSEDSIGGVSRWPSQIADFSHSGRIFTHSNQPVGRTNVFGKWMQIMRLLGDKSPSLVAGLGWLASENGGDPEPLLERPIRLINSYCSAKGLAFSYRDRFRHEITCVTNPSADFEQLTKEIQQSEPVAIHLRQGDYVNLSHIYGTSSLVFLKSALEELGQRVDLRNVWLFTDTPSSTPSVILDYLSPQRVIGPQDLTRPLENLVLMSQSKALVAANSSFSWWAAFLTSPGTPVVAPRFINAPVNNFSSQSELDPNWRIISV